MDDELKERFNHVDKRIDDTKTSINTSSGLIVGLFAIFSLIAGFGFSAERDRLKAFKDDLKEQVDNATKTLGRKANVEILGLDGKALNGKTLEGKIETSSEYRKRFGYNDEGKSQNPSSSKKEEPYVTFTLVLKNAGNKTTEPMYVKYYLNEPFHAYIRSADEQDFSYEVFLDPKSITFAQLPAGSSSEYLFWVPLSNPKNPIKGTFPFLFKVYSGEDKPSEARFDLVIK